ncbi:MAG TPA: hypothetical protein VNN72_26160 [Polyangiaceae bacterium]|nr:hypothetical protein [Polyangiaceae bacterium]
MRFFGCLFGYLLALVATAALLYRVRPDDDDFKAAFAQASRCNVLIVGPSYIKVGLRPEVFDAEAKALGHPLHVCSLARSALRGYEVMYDLKHLLEHRWPALRYVAVDVSLPPGNLGFDRDNWFSPRVVQWHTWGALTWIYRFYREQGLRWKELRPLAVAHLQHAGMNYLGVGRIGRLLTQARLIERLTGSERGQDAPKEIERIGARTKLVRPTEAEHDAAVRRLAERKARAKAQKRQGDDDWPRQLEPLIRTRKREPVFLYSPVYDNLPPPRLKRARKPALVFLDFDDPESYPTLYDYAVRGHTAHLNAKGAVLYSKLLAAEFVRLDSR